MQPGLHPKNLIQQIANAIPRYCDKCGAKYNHNDLEIVMNDDSKAVCKLGCTNCSNSYLIHVTNNGDGMLSMSRGPVQSDLSADELKKFSDFAQIENNEILDVYIALGSVQTLTDFESLFKE